jgi:hypothetical protein
MNRIGVVLLGHEQNPLRADQRLIYIMVTNELWLKRGPVVLAGGRGLVEGVT